VGGAIIGVDNKWKGDNMNDKFKLWGGGKMHDGRKVFRVQALKDFNDVKKGEKGGYIESEDNLSFKDGDVSWVYDDSIVYGKSTITGNSFVDKGATVKDSRLERGSRVSHHAQIEHTRVTASEIQNSQTFYANINESKVLHECVVKNTRLENSSVENGSEIYNSKMTNSRLVNDARVTRGADLRNRVVDGEIVNGQEEKAKLTLSTDDLADLNESSQSLQQ